MAIPKRTSPCFSLTSDWEFQLPAFTLPGQQHPLFPPPNFSSGLISSNRASDWTSASPLIPRWPGKSFYSSRPQFPHLQNGKNICVLLIVRTDEMLEWAKASPRTRASWPLQYMPRSLPLQAEVGLRDHWNSWRWGGMGEREQREWRRKKNNKWGSAFWETSSVVKEESLSLEKSLDKGITPPPLPHLH